MNYHNRFMKGDEMPKLHWVKDTDFRKEQNVDLNKI